jgi:glyoxylase-like metal-dependent hydrolase (beta-lactamase superfamily II)
MEELMTRTLKVWRPVLLLLAALLSVCAPSYGDTNARLVTKLADGVYEIQHQNSPGGASGNTTVIIGDREVFVVDSAYFPSVAREDIEQIRKWTDKPVGFLLITHYHNDHNNGSSTYMAAFPNLTIIAQEETKKDMDLIQPGNVERTPREYAEAAAAYKQGKDTDGRALTEDEKKQVQAELPILEQTVAEFKNIVYESPTLTFKHKIDIDLGNREVQLLHFKRGNTPGDAMAYLPKEKILVAGDLLVYPLPYAGDGYPSEWAETLHKMGQLDVTTIVPGHGPILHDKTYLYLVANLMQSSVDQVRARIRQLGFPGAHTLDEIKGSVDLKPFRQKFAGDDKDLQAAFDSMAASLVKITFSEAAQR